MQVSYYYKLTITLQVDVIAGIESRGFLFGLSLATLLKTSFVMLRKPGKLPGKVISFHYGTEYSKDTLNVQEGAVKKGQKVLVVDDLLATGGSAGAAAELIKQVGGGILQG